MKMLFLMQFIMIIDDNPGILPHTPYHPLLMRQISAVYWDYDYIKEHLDLDLESVELP